MKNKIKLKLSSGEIKALVTIIGVIQKDGNYEGIAGKASMQLIFKVFLKLMPRIGSLKKDKNSLSLSLPEAWAFTFQIDDIVQLIGTYEYNTWIRIEGEIDKCVV
jgi:hypothetical protein